MKIKATNHAMENRLLLEESDLAVGKNNIIAHVGGDNFIDSCDLLFSTADVAGGTATVGIALGSFPEKIIVPNIFTAPAIATAVAVSNNISLNVDASVKNGTKTDFRLFTVREVLKNIFTTKTSGHSITANDLLESHYNLVFTVTAGTIPAGYEIGFYTVIGM